MTSCVSFSSDEQSTKVKDYIIEILSCLVQDGDSLPQEVMDIILANILEPSKVIILEVVIMEPSKVVVV